MRIYLNYPDKTGCGYYRAALPHRHCAPILKEEGIDLVMPDGLDWNEDYDVYIFHRFVSPQFFPYLHRLKERGKTIVWELDDLLTEIPASNPASQIFRPHDYEGLKVCLEWADHIIVSTEPLKEYLGFEAKTTVLPNLVDLDDYPRTRFTEPDDVTRILWAGSPTHSEDLNLVVPALKEIKAKYQDKVQVIFFGMAPDDWQGDTFLPNQPLNAYPDLLQLIRPHIGLCPLVDSRFNRCKSAIKWYEMTLAGAVCVYSQGSTYEGLPGMFAIDDPNIGRLHEGDNWFLVLDTLLQVGSLMHPWKTAKTKLKHCFSWQSKSKETWLDFFRSLKT